MDIRITISFGALLLMLAAVNGDLYLGDENSLPLSQLWDGTNGETEELHDEKSRCIFTITSTLNERPFVY